MDYRALFGVVVRALGLVLIWHGLYNAFWAAAEKAGVDLPSQLPGETHALFVALYLVAGLVTIKAADFIVSFAYGSAQK